MCTHFQFIITLSKFFPMSSLDMIDADWYSLLQNSPLYYNELGTQLELSTHYELDTQYELGTYDEMVIQYEFGIYDEMVIQYE